MGWVGLPTIGSKRDGSVEALRWWTCYWELVQDPYALLGVDRRASEPEIRAAFRRLAAQYHPDKDPDDPNLPARFKEINLAYQILSDPQKRAAFDRYGARAFEPGGGNGRQAGRGFVDLGGLDNVFGDLLGALGLRPTDRGHMRQSLKLTFSEAALGCQKELKYDRVDLCERCGGRCAQPGTTLLTCPACGGRGRQPSPTGILFWAVDRPCARCRGTGQVPRTPCSQCKGTGLSRGTHRVNVDIPPGIANGSTRLVERAGHRTRPDRPAGNLEVQVEVAAHPYFRRVDDNVLSSVSISFAHAALGGDIEVDTLDGRSQLRIPTGTQPGTVLRLRGKGIPHRLRNGRGDHLVEVTVEVPAKLSDRARRLVMELGQELGLEPHAQESSLFDRLKGWFG